MCLHGKPLPASLKVLWNAQQRRDQFLETRLDLELLSSLAALEDGYGEGIADGNADILANVRAHHRVFSRLGFFAQDGDGGFLAFDLASPSADPPVVLLDNEGQYGWQGIHLAEAIFRMVRHEDGAVALAWLAAHGLPVEGPNDFDQVDIGASTQFLPSMRSLKERMDAEELGETVVIKTPPSAPAVAGNPTTWLRRPRDEVRDALLSLLGLDAGSTLQRQWIACDAEERISTLWFHDTPATHAVAVHGITFGMTIQKVMNLLGSPSRKGDGWMSFSRPIGRIRLGYKDEKVNEIYLGDD
jgi:hypothetical protein